MTTLTLYGELLDKPKLRFDYLSPSESAISALQGIKIYGPYDKNIIEDNIGKDSISLGIVYLQNHYKGVERLIDAFQNGTGIYPGFHRWYRLPIRIFERFPVEENSLDIYKRVLNKVVRRDLDLVYVIIDHSHISNDIYATAKTILLSNGIPCQIIRSERLYAEEKSFQWIIANISLATYAKIGGTPWVIEAEDVPEIILGMSRAMDRNKRYIVGFTTIFENNGDYLLWYSKSPVTSWEDYEDELEDLVTEAIYEYERIRNTPERIVFHFHKRTGRKEVNAIKNAVENIGKNIKYALLHLNTYSSFRVFDTSDFTYIPLTGLKIRLSSRQALLITDGRTPHRQRPYIGAPYPIEITMDKESTVEKDQFPRLVQQVYNLSYVNWRAFNARTVPVTINYPYLIAKLLGSLESIDTWNSIITNGRLVDKAWFL
jgi:hypothetical protein